MDLPTPEIAVGRAADLVLIDLNAEWEVGAQATRAARENRCFAGRRLKGKVRPPSPPAASSTGSGAGAV